MLTKFVKGADLNCSHLSDDFNKSLHLDPILHRCFNENPYDISQLPLSANQTFNKDFEILYFVDFYNLISLENKGSMIILADIFLSWVDSHRKWSKDQIPLDSILIPYNEVGPQNLLLQLAIQKIA